ncbi:MAG: tetratricopeptide repeat protein [Pseudomonadales bacterium]|nr:tetratricopeptide repeat protein [Pseudomonadales bacterium]
MQTFEDGLGVRWSAATADSIPRFQAVIEGYLGSRKDVPQVLDALIASDPEMAMATCFRAYLLKLAADPRFTGPLKQLETSLRKTASHLTTREQAHIEALSNWIAGDMDRTVDILEDILVDHPKDMLALRVAHYLHFYAGASGNLRDSIARSLSVWHENEPFYGYLLGMQAFGLEEAGDYAEAEAAGRKAVEINAGDIWAAHAVQHVFQMQGRFAEGIPWVEGLMPGWQSTNNFVYHMHWHKALCHIGAGEPDAALELYDTYLVGPLADDFYLDVANSASLLWRLEMLGVDVGDRWEPLRELSNARVTDGELLFCTLHYLMTPARVGDEDALQRGIDHFKSWARESSTQGHLCRSVGLPLAEAIVDFARGDNARAAELLSGIRDDIRLIGGSHAQRDIFNLFLQHAA